MTQSRKNPKNAQFVRDVTRGLHARPKYLLAKYFYDARGSEIFEAITKLPEYYPTRTEAAILKASATAIAYRMGKRFDLVERGAGDGQKTQVLLDRWLRQGSSIRYQPIDISAAAIVELARRMHRRYPQFPIRGIVGDHFAGLQKTERQPKRPFLVLFLGSSIGNFTAAAQTIFFKRLRKKLRTGDAVLVGFDLKKNPRVLEPAYDDAQGVTAAFNLNLLRRINRELGANFQIRYFQHHEYYNPTNGAMESYLLSTRAQTVRIPRASLTVHFAAWEPIHMEYSFKFLPEDVDRLAKKTGFFPESSFTDRRHRFLDALWRVR